MSNLLFGDHLFNVTDLNRQAAKVLDLALKSPVTIARGDRHFALMRRELAASLFGAASCTEELIDLLMACQQRLAETLPDDHEYAWMRVLDYDDLVELMRVSLESFRTSLTSVTDWTAFHDTVRDWRESALTAWARVPKTRWLAGG